MKRYLLVLALVVVLTYGLCFIYSIWLDAEVRFWKALAETKIEYANGLSSQEVPKVVFAGGSSCTFSIRPDVLKGHGVNSVNMGMHAGMGAVFNVAFGYSVLKEGDIFVIMLEPELLSGDFEQPTSLGTCLAISMGMPDLAVGGDLTDRYLSIRQRLSAIRPGGRRVITMLSKQALRRPIYRYKLDETNADGWCFTSYTDECAVPVGPYNKRELSDSGIAFLESIVKESTEKGAAAYFLSPWIYTEQSSVAGNRAITKKLLEQISEILPVIYDGYAGSCTNAAWYADTNAHLTPTGSIARTESIAGMILPLLK